jgi:hypothetical protein
MSVAFCIAMLCALMLSTVALEQLALKGIGLPLVTLYNNIRYYKIRKDTYDIRYYLI